jgi:hypothetical protein
MPLRRSDQEILRKFLHEAEQLDRSIKETETQNKRLRGESEILGQQVNEGIGYRFRLAIWNVYGLIQSALDWPRILNGDDNSIGALVQRPQAESALVARSFQALHREAKQSMETGKDVRYFYILTDFSRYSLFINCSSRLTQPSN